MLLARLMAWSGGTSPGRAGELLWSFLLVVVQRQVPGWFSAEHESLFMRQSTVALGRISAFLARSSHLEIWYFNFLLASYLAVTRPVSRCCMRNSENEFSDVSVVIRHAWLDSDYMFCISMRRFWTKFTLFLC